MQLRRDVPDVIEKYRAIHNEGMWPDMLEALRAHGAHDYVISVDEATLELFGSLLIEDEARWAAIAETDVCKRWWAACAELLECEDGRPKAVSLREMFFFKGA